MDEVSSLVVHIDDENECSSWEDFELCKLPVSQRLLPTRPNNDLKPTPSCRLADLRPGQRSREALRQALIADCTADPRTGQPGTGTFADLLEWIQLADFPDIPDPLPLLAHSAMNSLSPPPAQLGGMKAVQLALVPQRLEALVCRAVFSGNPLALETFLYLFTTELGLVQQLLWARHRAGGGDQIKERNQEDLQYTHALMSLFWREVTALGVGVTMEEGGSDTYNPSIAAADERLPKQDTLRDRVRILEVWPKKGNRTPDYNRHTLHRAPDFTKGMHKDEFGQLDQEVVAHLCAIRQQEHLTGQPSPSATVIADRYPHRYKLTALTAPLLNMCCDGFHACIAFHAPESQLRADQQTCFWAQARTAREYVLYMLLMLTPFRHSDILELKEGATGVAPQCGKPAKIDTDASTRACQHYSPDAEREEVTQQRIARAYEVTAGQQHVSNALLSVQCFEGCAPWLPLSSDLLHHEARRDALVLRRKQI